MSHITSTSTSRSRSRAGVESIRAIRVRVSPVGTNSSPAVSRNRTPRAAAAPVPPSAVALPPAPTMTLRAPADTGLPWFVDVDDQDPGAELESASSRRRAVLAGLVALGVFVLTGSAFIVRAVNRELEVSRLQADFVAAVSHEFRTPLTSIRQVSELLLEGRVPAGLSAPREALGERQRREGDAHQAFGAVFGLAHRTGAGLDQHFMIGDGQAEHDANLVVEDAQVFVEPDRGAAGR